MVRTLGAGPCPSRSCLSQLQELEDATYNYERKEKTITKEARYRIIKLKIEKTCDFNMKLSKEQTINLKVKETVRCER
jgi:hypothetical protein